MSKFNFIKPRKIAVVPLDRRIQITYKHHTVEYTFRNSPDHRHFLREHFTIDPSDKNLFERRVVMDWEECEKLFSGTFKEMFSPIFLKLGRLDVYVTFNPVDSKDGYTGYVLKGVLSICRCVKKVHLVDYGIPTAVGIGLTGKFDSIIFDLDKEVCYVSVFENGIIVDVEEMPLVSKDTVNRRMVNILQRRSDILKSRNFDVYLVGVNKNIAQIHSALEKKMNREIILFKSNTVISEGLDKIMSQEIHDAICYPKC